MGLSTILACLAMLPGCGEPPAAEARPLPPPAQFSIVYERGGGFAPSAESLVVRPGRRAVAKTIGGRAGERTVRFTIPRKRVLAIEATLRRAHFFSIESPGPSSCADCFFYTVKYRGHEVFWDQSQTTDALEAISSELGAVISARTIPPNA